MKLNVDKQKENTTIYLSDRFDFSYIEEFQESYLSNPSASYTIDFRDTDYMDSSGLGMLLNMKRSVGEAKIDLINCKSQIKKILVISRFDSQFSVH